MFTLVCVSPDLLGETVKLVSIFCPMLNVIFCNAQMITLLIFLSQISTNARLNRVRTEVLVKMESTAINVHVCLDLMGRIVKTVSIE